MCTSRGVPSQCHYENPSRRPTKPVVSQHGRAHIPPPADRAEPSPSLAYAGPAAEADVIDCVGYSRVTRRDQFDCLRENGVDGPACDPSSSNTVLTSDLGAYFKLVARLPPQPVTEKLIRIYFSSENWSFPVIDETCFRQLYEESREQYGWSLPPTSSVQLTPTLSVVPALLSSVLAVALQFTSTGSDLACALRISSPDECDRVSQYCLDTGQEIIDSLKGRKPNTTSIEYYLSKCT
ncbi:hypothetical protein LTR37_006247 [Vermiconidia calcicola]|uniref:Uncharacterized protein n=1 Tax=Vermiconidia calcicola TaxID=1690605 RepID=A0ACC3NGM6_9PEZI|nr:hypothetical protein LTR37_006247 [Vermiconidia calcicola]